MSTPSVAKLASIASDASGPRILPEHAALPAHIDPAQWKIIEPLYVAKNGFFAFESALQVFPLNGRDEVYGLEEWNSPQLWRHEFEEITDGVCSSVRTFSACSSAYSRKASTRSIPKQARRNIWPTISKAGRNVSSRSTPI